MEKVWIVQASYEYYPDVNNFYMVDEFVIS